MYSNEEIEYLSFLYLRNPKDVCEIMEYKEMRN